MARRDALQKEVNAKIAALEQQMARVKSEAKQDINKRIANLRAEYETRSAKLAQAWALAKQALAA